MKNWSLLFISFLFSNILFAQLEKPERQIGFDATAFITRFLTFNDQLSGTSNPEILFLYRKEKFRTLNKGALLLPTNAKILKVQEGN